MSYNKISVPEGDKLSIQDGKLQVGDRPIVAFIEGDGIGVDIWPVARKVLDSAVEKAYEGKKQIAWMEVFAGDRANEVYGEQVWLPDETVEAFDEYLVGIKGPLTTPIGGGIRSINVALRQRLDLYACVRPIQYFDGVPSPVKHPEEVSMTIFRENTEDIYAGIEFREGTEENTQFLEYLKENFPDRYSKIRFPESAGIGIKPISQEGTERLAKAALDYAIEHDLDTVTFVHKGNIMKFTEGAFRDWGYELSSRDYGAELLDGGPWRTIKNPNTGKEITVNDTIADAFLQQILLRPKEYDVVATMNLNGDYISDALAAQVGGIGIAPGANINYKTGHAIFEATHGTAPRYAGQNKVNPSSVILSGEMMLRHLGWNEAAQLIIDAIARTISDKTVTYDFHRMMDDATLLSCSAFGDAIIENM